MSASKDYLSLPLGDFLADLASRTPTPGGGSVAALTGALGAGLGRMALSFVHGKPAAVGHEQRIEALEAELANAQDTFTQLIQEDMAAYEQYKAARSAKDADAVAAALDRAVAVPMEIIVLAGAVAARMDEMKGLIGPHLLSDLRAAAILVHAAGRAASMSVESNLAGMADRAQAERLENQLDLLVGRLSRRRDNVVHYQPT